MHGIRRVIVFCILTAILPTILLIVPLYLRHSVFADVVFAVTESDIVEITDGVSSIFCSEHSLKMNETFNAFQVSRRPEKTSYRKHIRLKKSMTLPDDTLEYWGFYLLKGATVNISLCSRFEGASILVVKGERNLRTCGLMEHNKNKALASGIYLPQADKQVKITFESNAQEIHSGEQVPLAAIERDSDLAVVKDKKISNDAKKKIKKNNIVQNKANKTDLSEEREVEKLYEDAKKYLMKHKDLKLENLNDTFKTRHTRSKLTRLLNVNNDNLKINSESPGASSRRQRRLTNKQMEHLKLLEEELNFGFEASNEEEYNRGMEEGFDEEHFRRKRSQAPIKPELLDRGVRHGGNGPKINTSDEDSSISSFENSLLLCYTGNVLLRYEFNSSKECSDVNYLLDGKKHMQATHDVANDGYYYYIFYSDNDIVSNDINVVFDIYKPTLQYENVTRSCVNKTECKFPLDMTSSDRIIVEVPTRDGIDHDLDDVSLLLSVCHPRMGVYAIFPIAVLFLVLGCAFM